MTKKEKFVALVQTAATMRQTVEFMRFVEQNRQGNGKATMLSKGGEYADGAMGIVLRAIEGIQEEHLNHLPDSAKFKEEEWIEAAGQFIDCVCDADKEPAAWLEPFLASRRL